MQEAEFERWLLNTKGLSPNTISSRLSDCRRLETYEGDLDVHFAQDRLAGLIERLAYSTADERNNAPARHCVPLPSLRTGSATLKSAATRYKEFCESHQEEARRPEPSLLGEGKPCFFERVLQMSQPLPEHVRPAFVASAAFDLAATIAAGESDRVEFKWSLRFNRHTKKNDPAMEHAVIKTIAGFLNTHGGILIIGVADDGTPSGIDNDRFASEDKMNLHLVNLVNDKIGAPHWSSIRTLFDDLKGTRVLVVQCDKSTTPVYVKEGDTFYIRTGNATTALLVKDAVEYIKANFPR